MPNHKIFSANPALQSTSELLLELGLPPLPVAPAFPAEQDLQKSEMVSLSGIKQAI